MIDHVSIAVSDLGESTRYYEAVLAPLGFAKLEVRAKTVGFGKKYAELWINLRDGFTGAPDGAHICLRARSRDVVDAFHAAALANGGVSDGAPGLRTHDGEGGYYAAFVRDRDGNRIEAVTFVS
ncbi:glyoxalase-like domain protein [Variibacter gotjawalensis]|uniref:Glyoxalase-like domain protein n=1 Tax=Variibacter gotjawalensis TaxID=1333996 RepID=A0A0S3PYV8_9BRAD|nr:VOC family protein [Variibacter gotjawalensis]NIK46965.1 catechol 2,3-dioxygenase-like lactoylglutathione lyase family enzyme [Variibacter gotjawalensis]RZS48869.1 catechol 2,3-dioxygenase-like lactoylglutathione lyase family enzyme [Variibacter gotjawalensis]BAT61128.1 glyoxalase-like domain protein [Variibacter gotjawalensis]